jgi:hypothetical protein
MLMVSSYSKNYVAACRAKMTAQLDGYRRLQAAQPQALEAFERIFLHHMILALDRCFVHRGRGMEGKNGDALNEVRLLCDGILENGGRLGASKTMLYKPENTIVKLKMGEEISLDAAGFARLATAFFDAIEETYP